MRGLVLVNAFDKRKNVLNQSVRLEEEFEKKGVAADVLPNGFLCSFEGGEIVSEISGYDFIVYLDKDKYASIMLEKGGFRLFNPASAIASAVRCSPRFLGAAPLLPCSRLNASSPFRIASSIARFSLVLSPLFFFNLYSFRVCKACIFLQNLHEK